MSSPSTPSGEESAWFLTATILSEQMDTKQRENESLQKFYEHWFKIARELEQYAKKNLVSPNYVNEQVNQFHLERRKLLMEEKLYLTVTNSSCNNPSEP